MGTLCDIEGFVQVIPGSFKSVKPINITEIDKICLKSHCIQGSKVNGAREPILYSFALDKPPGYRIHHTAKNKLYKEVNKSVLSHITFYLEDDDHKPVDFIGEAISFTCESIETELLKEPKHD